MCCRRFCFQQELRSTLHASYVISSCFDSRCRSGRRGHLRVRVRRADTARPASGSGPKDSAGGERSRAKRLREIARSSGSIAAVTVTGAEAASVSGRVVNRVTGAPVARAQLSIEDPSGRPRAITCGADGRFLLDGAPPGVHVLVRVEAEQFLPWEGNELWSVKQGDHIEGITLILGPAVDYRGLVVDANEKPVAEASIRVLAWAVRG